MNTKKINAKPRYDKNCSLATSFELERISWAHDEGGYNGRASCEMHFVFFVRIILP